MLVQGSYYGGLLNAIDVAERVHDKARDQISVTWEYIRQTDGNRAEEYVIILFQPADGKIETCAICRYRSNLQQSFRRIDDFHSACNEGEATYTRHLETPGSNRSSVGQRVKEFWP